MKGNDMGLFVALLRGSTLAEQGFCDEGAGSALFQPGVSCGPHLHSERQP